MPTIHLQTQINAKRPLVFDLSRSIDLHKVSTAHTDETAIAGVTSGLIGLNETVTWRAKHFGVYHKLTSKITEFDQPYYFADEMVNGIFKRFKHQHYFEDHHGGTLMTDLFEYRSPLRILGRAADKLFLKKYMTELLEKRNATIKEFAETGRAF
ncbi:MAG: SRPBCC family protein [Flavobacterium sp.]